MKKSIYLLLCIILFTVPLYGCSNETEPLPTQETIHPYIVELMDSLPDAEDAMPDQVIAETDKYTFYRKNGICYLSFKSGNQQIVDCPDKECPLSHGFSFDSMEDLYQWLKAPEIDTNKEIAIRHTFLLDDENGFMLPDPYRLYTIETPDGYTVTNVNLGASVHRISFENSNHNDSQNVCSFGLEFCHEAMFPQWLSRLYSHKTNACNNDHKHEEYHSGNVTYVEWVDDDNSRSRNAYYVLETKDKTIFVSEYARIHAPENPSVTPEFPDQEDVGYLTYSNGAYYSLWNHCSRSCDYKQDEDVMQLKLINEFDIIHYVPTTP